MSFWTWKDNDHPAVVTAGRTYTYKQLNADIAAFSEQWAKGEKQLVLLLCSNQYDVLVAYLSALRVGHAVMLLSADMDAGLLERIIATYKSKWIYHSEPIAGYNQQGKNLWRRENTESIKIHADLAVMLSTSGTTGSEKFVRLSYRNIQSNAEAIAEYLEMDASERGIANLPMSYSYGLSILNSHLAVGATVLLTDMSVMEKAFWSFVKEERATSFAGVPFTYQMLQRIGFLKMDLPHLRMFTQAGGRLDERLVRLFAENAAESGKKFYVMYGQTEASPRISYIPPDKVLEKSGSIGVAIPGGSLQINKETSELIYRGENVMMGYAESVADLAKGDECCGILHTGDTATVDEDGYFTITGRLKRFVKLFGLRVNLDEVERRLEAELKCSVACTGYDERLVVLIEAEQATQIAKECLESVYHLHKSSFRVYEVERIPRLLNGKIDYVTIKDDYR